MKETGIRRIQAYAVVISLVAVLCAGCGTQYRGGAVPEVETGPGGPVGLDMTWNIETEYRPDGQHYISRWVDANDTQLETIFRQSGVFRSVMRADDGGDCHIRVVFHPSDATSGWEMFSIFTSLATLGIIPGYSKEEFEIEFRVQTPDGETRYHYTDHISTLWGWWGMLFPRDDTFILMPFPEGGDLTGGTHPGEDMFANIVQTFLVELTSDRNSSEER